MSCGRFLLGPYYNETKEKNLESEKLNVLILAAGLGTRLRPLTEAMPKPLVPVVDKSILEIQALRARELGNVRLHANAHYLADQVIAEGGRLGFEKVWEEPEILGTAGPLKRIYNEGYRGGLLVMNGDAYCRFDLNKFMKNACRDRCDVALLAVEFPQVNTFRVDENGHLAGVAGRFGSEQGKPATFSGVSWYSDAALARIKDGEFDIREFWKHELAAGHPILVDCSQMDATWIDMGSPAGLKAACDARLQELGFGNWVGDRLDSTVRDRISTVGHSVVQNGVELPESACVENSILFAGAAVEAGETVKDEIRGRGFSWKI